MEPQGEGNPVPLKAGHPPPPNDECPILYETAYILGLCSLTTGSRVFSIEGLGLGLTVAHVKLQVGTAQAEPICQPTNLGGS